MLRHIGGGSFAGDRDSPPAGRSKAWGDCPRVAHVTTIDRSLRYLLLDQLIYLERAGFDVCGVSSSGGDVGSLVAAGIPHHAVRLTRRMTPWSDLLAYAQLRRTFSRLRPAVVHTHTPKAGLLGQLAARHARVPCIVNTVHGFLFSDRTPVPARAAWTLVERVAGRCSDAILFQNSEDLAAAAAAGIGPRARRLLLGNGIDLARFDPARLEPQRQAALADSLGLAAAGAPDGAPVVGFVGRLTAEKGLVELCAAFARVWHRRRDARLLLVGASGSEERAGVVPQQLLAAHEVPPSVLVETGQREDVPELLGLMQVLALPSHREGFPRAAMEAAAMGLPVVASRERGCRHAVADGDTGILVEIGDVGGLVSAIDSLLADPNLRARMGRAGRALALRSFDQNDVFRRVEATYRSLLAEHAHHRSGSASSQPPTLPSLSRQVR